MVAPPRVAFALGRAVGPAVTRNLIRRRLRALLNEQITLPPGIYLVGAQPTAANSTFAELQGDLMALAHKIPS